MDVIFLPSELERHLEKINQESDIKLNIVTLVSEGREVGNLYLVLITSEGRSVIQIGKQLSLLQDLKEVNIQSCKKSLSKFKKGLLIIRNKLIMLQKIVGQNVEDCRELKHNYERTICEKHERLEYIDERVQLAEKAIDEYEKSASDYKQRANNLQESSDESKWKSVGHAGAGIICGTLAVCVGTVFAPFTGGASVPLAYAVASMNAGVNGANVVVNAADARDLAEKAQRARNRAHTAKCERSKLVDEKDSLLSEIGRLKQSIDKSKSQVENLEAFEDFLYRHIDSIGKLQTNAENFDAVIGNVSNQTDTFSIAQKTSDRRKNNYEFGQKMLKKLKSTWSTLATSIPELKTAGDQKSIDGSNACQ